MVGKTVGDYTLLNNGVKMPWLGIGVWPIKDGEEVEKVIDFALKTGYRLIDTASFYGNETGIGKAVYESDIPRSDIFVTTKVWNSDQGYDSTLQAFEQSRKKLGLEYIDLYLIHWAVKGKYKQTWKALEKLYKDGYVRAIGVSNFQIHHLKDIMEHGDVVPTVNQVECHPRLTQKELHSFCRERGIQMEAWSPLMQGHLDHPILIELGQKYNKNPAQIVLRWDLQNEVIAIPKSVSANRIIENCDIFNFELTTEDIEKINTLNQDKRFGAHPDNF